MGGLSALVARMERLGKRTSRPRNPSRPSLLPQNQNLTEHYGMRINDWLLTIAQSSGKVWNAWTKRVLLRVSMLT